jgi:hypothetical protein
MFAFASLVFSLLLLCCLCYHFSVAFAFGLASQSLSPLCRFRFAFASQSLLFRFHFASPSLPTGSLLATFAPPTLLLSLFLLLCCPYFRSSVAFIFFAGSTLSLSAVPRLIVTHDTRVLIMSAMPPPWIPYFVRHHDTASFGNNDRSAILPHPQHRLFTATPFPQYAYRPSSSRLRLQFKQTK